MTGPRHSVSVAGIVLDDHGRILTIRRRDTGDWQPPGGILDLKETIDAGLRREVLEETGVLVEPQRLTGVYKNLPLGVIALVFRCRAVSGTPTPANESTEVRWLTLNEITASMTPAFAIRVTDALHDEPAIRAHDGINLINH
jgi:8-oxo-dGTP diphosphatase